MAKTLYNIHVTLFYKENKMSRKIKKIKESIGKKEYNLLQADLQSNKKIRPATKRNLSRIYCNCFYTGIRLNENQGRYIIIKRKEYRIGLFASHIKELFVTGVTRYIVSKQMIEKDLYLTPSYREDILKYFDLSANDDELVVSKGSNKNNKSPITIPTLIDQVNKHMRSVLGKGFSSHSFRQGFITEMFQKKVDARIVQLTVGHRRVEQTQSYYKPTKEDIRNNLIR